MKTVVFACCLSVGIVAAWAGEKHPFRANGVFTEVCSCEAPCACEMLGLEKGCEGVGVHSLSKGSRYNGEDISGVKFAYAGKPGDWIRLYIDAPTGKREAAEAFARAAYSPWGKIEAVKDAAIEISEHKGAYTIKVDDGKIMKYSSHVVLGGDEKTPVAHDNLHNPFNPTVYQALGEGCTFKDDDRTFTIDKNLNSYFNDRMRSAGEI